MGYGRLCEVFVFGSVQTSHEADINEDWHLLLGSRDFYGTCRHFFGQ